MTDYASPERLAAVKDCEAYKLVMDRLRFFEEHSPDQEVVPFPVHIRQWMQEEVERAEAELIEAVRMLKIRRDIENGKRVEVHKRFPMQPYGTGSTNDEFWPGQMRGVPDGRSAPLPSQAPDTREKK